MPLNPVFEKLTHVIREVFEIDSLIAEPHMTSADVATWDSMNHIRLILAVEKNFAVKFSTAEISGFDNLGQLADKIIQKTAV